MSLTQEIKEYALDIGYSNVGMTTAEPFTKHRQEVISRGLKYDFYLASHRRYLSGADPRTIMPSARSIVALVWDYAQRSFPKELVGKVGRIYQSRCYRAPADRINGTRNTLIKDFLTRKGCRIGENIGIPERWAGARAGVTTFGKNTFAYADGVGSFVVLSSFVIDAELEYDDPTEEIKCPPDCSACMQACPTQAIYEPMKLDPRRCIAFHAWMTQDDKPGVSTSFIPHDMRDKMGTRVHGCDVCQEACPRNAIKVKGHFPPDRYLEIIAKDFSLVKMLEMSDEYYRTRVQPIMYNYIHDPKYFKRNAAIALGNMGDSASIPALKRAMKDPEEIVRGYAAWALGKIGGGRAKRTLESCVRRELSRFVMNELRMALHALE